MVKTRKDYLGLEMNIDFYCLAILSVYDKTGLLEFAKDLHALNVRLLGSGGTAKLVREAGIPIG